MASPFGGRVLDSHVRTAEESRFVHDGRDRRSERGRPCVERRSTLEDVGARRKGSTVSWLRVIGKVRTSINRVAAVSA